MSVLSLPQTGKSIRPARSFRNKRHRLEDSSTEEVLKDFGADESKYRRELRTLVDGVIPVLVWSVLSKSGSAAAAGLFTSPGSASEDCNFTKPIVDMGVALERLKTLHGRVPTSDPESIISWAQSAHRVYAEYIKAWRLGFHDVVVNLAPADGRAHNGSDLGMARDEQGDAINSEGQKVDVAYLLKRPLVRIKNLSKVLSRLQEIKPSSRTSQVSEDYAELVAAAKRRNNDEQARLEDEAATNIDATKARDLQTLAVLAGTTRVDKSRRVKARDSFSLTLYHSSGQRIDCRVELLLRDNQPGTSDGGDLLVCEVDETSRWLLFPPFETTALSARIGDTSNDLVLMIRGSIVFDRGWHELLALRADDAKTPLDWLHMLGSNPLPPKLDRTPSFTTPPEKDTLGLQSKNGLPALPAPLTAANLGSTTVQIPIGEPSVLGTKSDEGKDSGTGYGWREKLPSSNSVTTGSVSTEMHSTTSGGSPAPYGKHSPTASKLSLGGGLATPKPPASRAARWPLANSVEEASSRARWANAWRSTAIHSEESSPVKQQATTSSKPERGARPQSDPRKLSRTNDASREWMGSPLAKKPVPLKGIRRDPSPQKGERPEPHPASPRNRRSMSSTPSKDLPTITRTRPSNQASPPSSRPLNKSIRDQWNTISGFGKKNDKTPEEVPCDRNRRPEKLSSSMIYTEDVPSLPVRTLDRSNSSPPVLVKPEPESKPQPPPHRHPVGLQNSNPAVSQQTAPQPNQPQNRPPSSPLKHEYAPSTASETGSESDSDPSSMCSSSSETSGDELSEDGDVPTRLVPLPEATAKARKQPRPPSSFPSRAATTLAPSDSASQSPYRSVPAPSSSPNGKVFKAIATVCAWRDKGFWEPLHPDECSIVASPGFIEAFEMSAAHSGIEQRPGSASQAGPGTDAAAANGVKTGADASDPRPLVAFELTPHVLLCRGTALDIQIRSRSTERSKVQTSQNVMFRSRNVEECEALYAMINYARCNNPTFIALERARPKIQPSVTFNTGQEHHTRSRSRSGSWFGLGSRGSRSSYRASSTPGPGPPSVAGASEASVASMASSFLRRLSSGENGLFNLRRSSVMRRSGGSANASQYSSSSGTTTTGAGNSTPSASQLGQGGPGNDPGAAVVNNVKIRLYVRKMGGAWDDLGSARLTVLPAPNLVPATSGPAGHVASSAVTSSPAPRPDAPSTAAGTSHVASDTVPRLPSSHYTPHRVHGHGQEKRIIVVQKKSRPSLGRDGDDGQPAAATLIDALLGESRFERVGRVGIAISVWAEDEKGVKKEGGVTVGKTTVYMMQFRNEAAASWVFELAGRLRY